MSEAVVFDIDNTLTPPRRPFEEYMANVLMKLPVPFYLAAGSDLPLIMDQFFTPLHKFGYRGEFHAFICNGSSRYRCVFGEELSVEPITNFNMKDHFGIEQFANVVIEINQVLDSISFQLPDSLEVIGERIIDRDSMINVAPIGRTKTAVTEREHENRDAFVAFDKETGYRAKLLPELNERLNGVLTKGTLQLSLGGETSIDIVAAGQDKSLSVIALIEQGYTDLRYFGDALFEGGNDEAVAIYARNWQGEGECPVKVVQVDGWKDTAARLEDRYSIPLQ